MEKRPSLVCCDRQSIRPSTRFRRLPVWVSKADIVAYLKLGPTDAQALFDSAPRQCLIDGVEKISKYQLQFPPYPDLIRVMQRHPSRPSSRRVSRAAIEKVLRDSDAAPACGVLEELGSIGQACRMNRLMVQCVCPAAPEHSPAYQCSPAAHEG